MNFIDLFKLSTRMFKARTSRTFLTILGMSIGIAAILFLVSLGYGLQETLLKKITTADALLTLDVTEARESGIILDKQTTEKVGSIEGVEEVSPAFNLSAQGHFGELSADITATVAKPSFVKLGGKQIIQGESLKDENREGIVITSTVAQVFGKSPEEIVQKEVTFSFFVPSDQGNSLDTDKNNSERFDSDIKYKIAGVIESDESTAYINADSLSNLNIARYSQLKVKCSSSDVMAVVRDKIVEQGLLVSALSDTVEQANQVFRVIQIILMLFGVIALVVSAIGMFNTMTIALLERTEEIGIMKSIGASNKGISLMFMMESAIMGFLGGIGGTVMGVIGGETFDALINFIAEHFGGQPVNLFHSPLWFIILILIFASVVGVATGFVPARRASRIDPLDALRYK